jgi:hypothetical protein
MKKLRDIPYMKNLDPPLLSAHICSTPLEMAMGKYLQGITIPYTYPR